MQFYVVYVNGLKKRKSLMLQYQSKGLQHYMRVKRVYYTHTLHAASTQCPRSAHAPYMQAFRFFASGR